MTRDQLLRVIDEAAQKGLAELDLSKSELTELPPEIGQLTQLEKLILGNQDRRIGQASNQIRYLPPEIGKLRKLSWLDLSSNQLNDLPAEIGDLKNLSILNLRDNRLQNLPPSISKLKKITRLSLYGNQLQKLPIEITQLTNLSRLDLSKNKLRELPREIGKLRNLSRLYLRNNCILRLPEEIGQLQNLSQLDLRANQLSDLDVNITKLYNLLQLDISENRLTTLPIEINQLQELSALYLSDNHLRDLPESIGQLQNLLALNLRANKLRSLPIEINQLRSLSALYLEENPSLLIPPEILNKSDEPAKIINYYLRGQAEPTYPLNEAKVLLVGEAKVGKTSLIKRLIDGTFDTYENMTEGINIRKWSIVANNQKVKLNMWDFGGQEIMHATHQFFLTRRSLYLLVLNARQDDEGNRVEYWLKIIRSFGEQSPVIIVGNQVDQKPLEVDQRGLRRKYPNIVGFIETSCSDLGHRGISKLRYEVQRQITRLPYVFDTLPASWFAVKDKLEKLKADYINYYQYQQLCRENKVADEQSQETLISFLHDLGVALSFREDPRLRQDNILNPEWVTKGVYSILNDNALMTSHKGILERSMLHRILDSKAYPADKHFFILDIMRKFELCFPLEGYEDERYLIPDLLGKEEPETGTWGEALPFQYHYRVLPSSVISRFIVRMNQLISRRTYWRNGVVLVRGDNRALVKADKEDRKIFVWINGSQHTRRILLESIRNDFDYIHSSIPGLEVEEKVPLPSNPHVLVDYKNLLDMEAIGVEDFVPSGLRQKVRVRDLLEGIETDRSRENRQESRKELEQRFPPPAPVPNTSPSVPQRPNGPWQTGSFYLIALALIGLLFALIGHYAGLEVLALVIGGSILGAAIIGVFQQLQAGNVSEAFGTKALSMILERVWGHKQKQLSSKDNTDED
ncbi:MAG: COR domain-containing protein [Leptolyngbyaceae cyanobacterium]